MSFSANEVNILIQRYLQESGFVHTAFVFNDEAHIGQSNIDPHRIPYGALISVIQKGIQYTEAELCAEQNLEEGSYEPLSLIEAVIPNISLRPTRVAHQDVASGNILAETDFVPLNDTQTFSLTSRPIRVMPQADSEGSSLFETVPPMVINGQHLKIPDDRVIIYKDSGREVTVCAWNPTQDLVFASGSTDRTASIYDLNMRAPLCTVLLHQIDQTTASEEPAFMGITALDWNNSGQFLATATFDGFCRIWSTDGSLIHSERLHSGGIMAIKWNKHRQCLLTAGVDSFITLWDFSSRIVIQKYAAHSGPVLDVDWQSDSTFATCSTDKLIHVWERTITEMPVKTFVGHTSDVNAVKWNSSGRLLASCSDDMTVKVWSLDQDCLIYDLVGHQDAIYRIDWSPTDVLASGSADSTVRVWGIHFSSSCVHTLTGHTESIFSVAFSPDGQLLASCSSDKYVFVWSTTSGQLVHFYKCSSGVIELSWHPTGDRLVVSSVNGSVILIDLRG